MPGTKLETENENAREGEFGVEQQIERRTESQRRWGGVVGKRPSLEPKMGLLMCVALIAAALGGMTLGCRGGHVPPPRPGVIASQKVLMVPVPGGRVNVVGGNLLVALETMSLDTRIGDWKLGAVWNSASGIWLWNIDSSLIPPEPPGKLTIFTDDAGTRLIPSTAGSGGKAFGGSHWIRHATDAIRTLGGVVHNFDGAGELASIHWISSRYPALEFERASVNGFSRVARIEQCKSAGDCSTLMTLGYDLRGRLVSVVDLVGRTALYSYVGASNRIAVARDPLDLENGWPGSRYQYDLQGRLVAITNSQGERVEYGYYGSGKGVIRVVQVGEGNPTWKLRYGAWEPPGTWDSAGAEARGATRVIDPLGGVTKYDFDNRFRLWKLTDASGDSWQWTWYQNSLDPKKFISPAGAVRKYGFYTNGGIKVSTESLPNGNVIRRGFAPYPAENRGSPFESAISFVQDDLATSENPIESRTYSTQGVLESILRSTGEQTVYAFEANGDLLVMDPAGMVTAYSDQGEHGHFRSVTRGGKTVNYTFDAVGNLLTGDGLLDDDPSLYALSVAQGGIVARSYDANRNVSGLTLEEGGFGASGLQSELSIDWRSDHRPFRIERPFGGHTEFIYDGLGRPVEERTLVNGNWVSTYSEFDAVGRVTAVLKSNGMATRATYESAGRVASTRHERDWTDPSEFDGFVNFVYANGRRVGSLDSAHGMVAEAYLYNQVGQLAEVRFPDGEYLTYEYDLRERIVRKQFWRPDSSLLRTFEYEYDGQNRMIATREDGVDILNRTLVDGRVSESLYGNGVTVINEFDAITGQFRGYTARDAAQQMIASSVLTWGECDILMPASRCVIEQTDSWVGVLATSYAELQLEDQGTERLIADSHGWQFSTDSNYGYDELSNVLHSPLGSFVYNAEHNRLLGIDDGGTWAVDYEYDEAGYVTARNGVPITWNGMGRLVSIGDDVAMEWDALGRQVSSSVNGEENFWKYGGEMGEDEYGQNQVIDLGWVVCYLDTSEHDYRLYDFRRNGKLMIDDDAEVVAHHHYAGYEQVAVDGVDESGVGFAGGTHIGDLVAIGARILDPTSRRFLSQDSIYQVVNQYGYTLGNPVRFWDPSGLDVTVIISNQDTTQEPGLLFSADVGMNGPIPTGSVGVKQSGAGDIHTVTVTITLTGQDARDAVAQIMGSIAEGAKATKGERIQAPTLVPRADSTNPYGTQYQGSGSTGKGRNGPPKSKGSSQGNKGSAGRSGGSYFSPGIACGLGFEVGPLLWMLFWVRDRTRRGVGWSLRGRDKEQRSNHFAGGPVHG